MATILGSKGCKYYLSATVEPEMIKRIDAIRGEVPRSRIVVDRALSQYLDNVELANKNNKQEASGERRNNS
jgi:predicted membrane GTPase involved in stress response